MALWLTIAFLIACGLILASTAIIGNHRIIEDGDGRRPIRADRRPIWGEPLAMAPDRLSDERR
jgi:hypothetical protein